jgi:hypothetical protein
MAIVFIVMLAAATGVLHVHQTWSYGACGDSIHDLDVGLSSVKPDWEPKHPPSLLAINEGQIPTFNTNSDSWSVVCDDERRFILLRNLADEESPFRRVLSVQPGGAYEAYVFFGNDATNAGEDSESIGTRISIEMPDYIADRQPIKATISSDNSQPSMVWSTAVFDPMAGQQATHLVIESAALYSVSKEKIAELDKRELASKRGAAVGCSQADGRVPARCFGYLLIRIKALKSSYTAKFEGLPNVDSHSMTTSIADSDSWTNSILVGRTKDWWLRFTYQNTGEVTQPNVKATIMFPQDLSTGFYLYTSGAYVTGTKIPSTDVTWKELGEGLGLGPADPGDETSIYLPFSRPEDDFVRAICQKERTIVSMKIEVSDYYPFSSSMTIYPDRAEC